uniref:Uncharacterized protein n=1 Tax=Arundo donax TaxID=35708 RepID=A0A0A8Z4L4_ARUDO
MFRQPHSIYCLWKCACLVTKWKRSGSSTSYCTKNLLVIAILASYQLLVLEVKIDIGNRHPAVARPPNQSLPARPPNRARAAEIELLPRRIGLSPSYLNRVISLIRPYPPPREKRSILLCPARQRLCV